MRCSLLESSLTDIFTGRPTCLVSAHRPFDSQTAVFALLGPYFNITQPALRDHLSGETIVSEQKEWSGMAGSAVVVSVSQFSAS